MLLVNKWRTPDGTVLQSMHRHDYVSHTDTNGKIYAVDGGTSYCRLIGEDMENLCVYSDDQHERIRENFTWGTRGIRGNLPVKYKLLKDLDTARIEAILDTQVHISEEIKKVFEDELRFRENTYS